jgi:hypothetical protein
MILATPIAPPYPVDAFLKPASKESSDIATVVCSTNSKKPCIIPVHVGLFFDGTNNNMARDRNGTRTELDGKPKKSGAIAQPSLEPEQASHSNVARLFLAFPDDKQSSGYFSHYIQGVGTPFKEIGELTETNDGKAFAKGGQARIIWGIFQVLDSLHRTVFGDVDFISADEIGRLAQKHVDEVGRVERNVEDRQNERMTHRQWFEPHLQKLKAKLASQLKPTIPTLNVSVFGFSRGAAEATAFCHFFAELLSVG